MAIDYNFAIEGNVLQVKAIGMDDSYEKILEYNNAVIQRALETGINKILCDEREFVYDLSVFEIFKLAEAFSQHIHYDFSIVFICSEKQMDHCKFFETVARNRGLSIWVSSDYQQGLKRLND